MSELGIANGWWIVIVILIIGYIGYNLGYRSGADRALRDNVKKEKVDN